MAFAVGSSSSSADAADSQRKQLAGRYIMLRPRSAKSRLTSADESKECGLAACVLPPEWRSCFVGLAEWWLTPAALAMTGLVAPPAWSPASGAGIGEWPSAGNALSSAG